MEGIYFGFKGKEKYTVYKYTTYTYLWFIHPVLNHDSYEVITPVQTEIKIHPYQINNDDISNNSDFVQINVKFDSDSNLTRNVSDLASTQENIDLIIHPCVQVKNDNTN